MLAFTLSKLFKLAKLSNLSLKLEIKPDLSTKLKNLSNLGLATSKPNNKIIIDLGTSKHYLLNKDWFSNYIEIANKFIIIANS